MLHQGPRRGPQQAEEYWGAPQGQPPPSIGLDRPAIDATAWGAPLMSTLLFEGPPKYPYPPHPIFARYAGPPYYDLACRYTCVCPFLSVSTLNRVRTACMRLIFLGDGSRLIGGTAGGELVVWGGSTLGFEDLKRLPRSGGAVTALEADCLRDRIYVGDAGGQVASLSLALSPAEQDSLMQAVQPPVSSWESATPLLLCFGILSCSGCCGRWLLLLPLLPWTAAAAAAAAGIPSPP
ncbi:hypothetical protein Emed_006598 [Eimeria media]